MRGKALAVGALVWLAVLVRKHWGGRRRDHYGGQ